MMLSQVHEKLISVWIWLKRIAYCRGFGIQSPSAYTFVRYVINEHYPYYAYDELSKRFLDIDYKHNKLYRLYFRLVNYVKPKLVFDIKDYNFGIRQAYYKSAKRNVKVHEIIQDEDLKTCKSAIIKINAESQNINLLDKICSMADSSTLLIVEDIYRNEEAKSFWQQIINNDAVGVTFDLYYCGIAMFDLSKHKQNYTINF